MRVLVTCSVRNSAIQAQLVSSRSGRLQAAERMCTEGSEVHGEASQRRVVGKPTGPRPVDCHAEDPANAKARSCCSSFPVSREIPRVRRQGRTCNQATPQCSIADQLRQ